MARTQDRWIISEAIRKQELWCLESIGRNFIVLMTDYDERLEIYYGTVGQVLFAEYTHWDSSDPSRDVMSEMIRQNKRKRVLELINQKDVS